MSKYEYTGTSIRAYELVDGAVVEINGLLLEFEDGLFYEVEKGASFINPVYKRTGVKYSPSELEEYFKA